MRYVAWVIAMLLLAGCTVDQDREVATYRKVVDVASSPRDPARPLTLTDALRLANQKNEQLSVRGEAYLQALIDRHRTVANFLPTIDFIASRGAQDGPGGSDERTTMNGQLSLNVFNGFRDVNRYWRDTFLIDQRRNELLSFQETLLLDVVTVYYQVLRSEAQVGVLEHSVQVQDQRLNDTQARLDVGFARPLDLAQTKAQLSATRTQLLNARRDVANGRAMLTLLTGTQIADTPLSDQYDVSARLPTLDACITQSYATRDDLHAAGNAMAAARHDVEVAFGQYYPSVTLNLDSLIYSNVPELLDWSAYLRLSVPVFAAGRINADVRTAWSFFREAVLMQAYLRRQVEQQVRTAYTNLMSSEARLAELHVQLAAAQQAFEQADSAYHVGLATNLDRIVAQDALLSAQLALASEEFDYKLFYLSVLCAVGQMRERTIDPPPAR